jgi:hypothetical protein
MIVIQRKLLTELSVGIRIDDYIRKDQVILPSFRLAKAISDLPIEILQKIFSYLNVAALLKCRCVCALWNNCIPGDSGDLREALFLPKSTQKPIGGQPFVLEFDIYTDDARNMTRYLTSMSSGVRQIHKVVLTEVSQSAVTLHPFIEEIDRYMVAEIPPLNESGPTSHRMRFASLKNISGDLLQPDDLEYWREMSVTMPPVTEILIHFNYQGKRFEMRPTMRRSQQYKISSTEGVKFVDLFKIVDKQIAGLLRLETLRRINRMPKDCARSAELRGMLSNAYPLGRR